MQPLLLIGNRSKNDRNYLKHSLLIYTKCNQRNTWDLCKKKDQDIEGREGEITGSVVAVNHTTLLAAPPRGMAFISVRMQRNSPIMVMRMTETVTVSHQATETGKEAV